MAKKGKTAVEEVKEEVEQKLDQRDQKEAGEERINEETIKEERVGQGNDAGLGDKAQTKPSAASAPEHQPTDHPAQHLREQVQEEQTHKFVVRLPMPLRNRIAEAAKYFRRSMNSEIIARLEQSLQGIPSQAESDQLAPQMHDSIQNIFSTDLTADEELVLRAFRRMSVEKQRALLELLG